MNTDLGRARPDVYARGEVTAPSRRAARASAVLPAKRAVTEPPDDTTIDRIRLLYRRAKAAEQARIRIDLGLYAYARVYFSSWNPGDEAPSRTKAAAQAKRVVDGIRAGKIPAAEDEDLHSAMEGMVMAAEASRQAFEVARKGHRKEAEKLASQLPAWSAIQHVRGFSVWGLIAVIGEAGDVGEYSGCRKLFKRLGLAPDECYPQGEKKTGRKIPRNTRGRIMGIIADALLRAQWRGPKEDSACQVEGESHPPSDRAVIPAHAIGPFGAVYSAAKVRQLASGKTKGHAEKSARRAMIKALLHDVHDAWHGRPLTYSAPAEAEAA